jgi:hypothetical protein
MTRITAEFIITNVICMGLLFHFGQNALDWYTEIYQKQKPYISMANHLQICKAFIFVYHLIA